MQPTRELMSRDAFSVTKLMLMNHSKKGNYKYMWYKYNHLSLARYFDIKITGKGS